MTDSIIAGGIYEILNTVNGKRYIGSAVNFNRRWRGHRFQLNKQKHHSVALQRAWNKYGAEAFQFNIAMLCAPEDVLEWEQIYLDGLKPEYNACDQAGSRLGVKHTPEVRAKISDALRNRGPISAETRTRLSNAQKGRPSRAPHSLESRNKISKSNMGRMVSLETREKISNATTGKPKTFGPLGNIFSDERRRKIGDALRGKLFSSERRKKLSEAALRRCARERLEKELRDEEFFERGS